MTEPDPTTPQPPGELQADPLAPWVPARTSFFTAMGVPLSWVLAALNLFSQDKSPKQRLWTKALIALALFDVLVVVALVVVTRNAKELPDVLTAKPAKAVIGVVVEEEPVAEGLKVAQVTAGGPSEAANIAVGDVIDTCDGKPVRSRSELRGCVGKFEPGAPVKLRVLRGDVVREAQPVVTVKPTELRAPVVAPLHQSVACSADLSAPSRGTFVAWLLFVLLGGFTWVRRGGPSVLILALAIAVIAVMGTYVTAGLCLLHVSEGARDLLELPLSPLALLAVAWGVNRFTLNRASVKLLSGSSTWWITAGVAAWTHVWMMARLAVVIAAFMLIFKPGPISSTPVEQMLSQGPDSWLMKALFFVTAAVLAPIAEEYFFRGVALTGLLRVLRPSFAILAIAVVFGLLHGGYGVRTLIVVSLGGILGWARWDSRGLLAPICLHFAQNAVVSVVFLLR